MDGRVKPGHDGEKASLALQPRISRLHGIAAAVELAQIGQAAHREPVLVLLARDDVDREVQVLGLEVAAPAGVREVAAGAAWRCWSARIQSQSRWL